MPALLLHGGQVPLLSPATPTSTSLVAPAAGPLSVTALAATGSLLPDNAAVPSATPPRSFIVQPPETFNHPTTAVQIDLTPYAPETGIPDSAIASTPSASPTLHEISEQAHGWNSLALVDSASTTGSELQQMGSGKRIYPVVATIAFGLITFLGLDSVLYAIQSKEEAAWISTSSYWLDRKACTWFGLCGLQHMFYNPQRILDINPDASIQGNHTFDWLDGEEQDPDNWSPEERILRDIPQYVLDHAPYVHLYSGEEFWPSDIAEHLIHTTPHLNYTPIDEQWQHPNLSNLWKLNYWGRAVYLQSDDNVEERPEWLGSKVNIPERPERNPGESDEDEWYQGKMYKWQQNLKEDLKGNEKFHKMGVGDLKFKGGERKNPPGVYPPGQYEHPFPEPPPPRRDGYKSELRKRQTKSKVREQWKPSKRLGGKSDAPAVLIVVDKGHGVVDAFWFFFYSYNLGNTVFNVRFGNHVGDWEHTVIRFYKGKPKLVFFSEHSGGEAYTYNAVERFGKRPVAYSATGTHAMYATPGVHAYILPFGLLHDITDRGPLWDPLLNLHAYTYDYRNDTLRTSTLTPKSPRGWFYFMGHWGDKYYPLSDPRQYRFAGQYHYVNGPLGPRFKNLGRRMICQWVGECNIRGYIGEAGIIRKGTPVGKGDGDADNGNENDPDNPEIPGDDDIVKELEALEKEGVRFLPDVIRGVVTEEEKEDEAATI